MITKFNKFNENLLNKMKGKNENEIIDLYKKYDNMQSLLVKSVKNENQHGVKYAIDNGADIKNDNYASVRYAILNCSVDFIRFLLETYNVDLAYNDYVLLAYAVNSGDLLTVKYILELCLKQNKLEDDYFIHKIEKLIERANNNEYYDIKDFIIDFSINNEINY